MSHDSHNHNGHSENKPVSFTAPLILGAVTVFIILCFVSLGNPCRHKEMCCEDGKECSKECMEACEKGDHSKHPNEAGHEGTVEHNSGNGSEDIKEPAGANVADSTQTGPENTGSTKDHIKEEAHH
jgi:hypothetical protein